MKKLVSLAVALVLALSLVACGSSDSSAYKDGTYRAEAADYENGYKPYVELTISGGKITAVDFDCISQDGTTLKSDASRNGDYIMTTDGPLWADQAIAIENYVVENNGVANLTVDENGKTDAIASVSIGVSEMVELVNECLEQAK